MQRFLEIGAAGKLFEAAPVFRAGLLVSDPFDLGADRFQIQLALLAGANVLELRLPLVFTKPGFVLLDPFSLSNDFLDSRPCSPSDDTCCNW